ncbi:hypothetical protein FISHEDRAFT_48882 [Fistulina hepatica ATCC 64428]|uniref:Hemerythrin-like domain-containing protein n=1 Tax=Fistulina hepatica ATCC 64428 TaxID=1128425 RepID=A0A0D7A6U5_9AGAR|nr:hypothetical protein FISHEDRAFT_48882 [Fistulina hepatica ATCC 64428]
MATQVEQAITASPDIQHSKFVDSAVLAEVSKIEKAAVFTRPELASEKTKWSMAWMHLIIWHSWKSTYYWASHIPEGDFVNYKEYALLSVGFLVDHHNAEESALFPVIEERSPGSMAKNHEQHESFLKEVEDLVAYLQAATEESFDAAALRGKVDSILFLVMQHLADELDSLDAEVLRKSFSEEELAVINKATHTAQQETMPGNRSLPFVLQNLPPHTPFPPAPGFVKNIIGPWIMYWKFAALWKYTTFPWKQQLAVPAL